MPVPRKPQAPDSSCTGSHMQALAGKFHCSRRRHYSHGGLFLARALASTRLTPSLTERKPISLTTEPPSRIPDVMAGSTFRIAGGWFPRVGCVGDNPNWRWTSPACNSGDAGYLIRIFQWSRPGPRRIMREHHLGYQACQRCQTDPDGLRNCDSSLRGCSGAA